MDNSWLHFSYIAEITVSLLQISRKNTIQTRFEMLNVQICHFHFNLMQILGWFPQKWNALMAAVTCQFNNLKLFMLRSDVIWYCMIECVYNKKCNLLNIQNFSAVKCFVSHTVKLLLQSLFEICDIILSEMKLHTATTIMQSSIWINQSHMHFKQRILCD